MKNKSTINIEYLDRCIQVLKNSYERMKSKSKKHIDYDMYRAACIKEFEIILEQCGKLLKKQLREFFHSNKVVDELKFKDIFRHAAKHGLITAKHSERWLKYRDNRNDTAHDYGEGFAEQTLKLLPDFISDAENIVKTLK